MTNAEIRNWYKNRVSEGTAKLEADIKRENRTANMSDAKKAYDIRHQARIEARSMMKPSDALKLRARDMQKYGNPDGPSWKQTVEKYRYESRRKLSLAQSIIDSGKRTNKDWNKNNRLDRAIKSDRLKSQRARLAKYDTSKQKLGNDVLNSVKNQSKDLLKARVKVKKPGDNKNNAKERLKAQYGKPKDAKSNLAKSAKEKAKLTPKIKEPKVASSPESRGVKKAGTTEKMASLRKQGRDRAQKRERALKPAKDRKATQPKPNRDSLKSRYGKPSDSNRGKRGEAQSKKPSETKQPRTSSTPKTDSKPKPSGDTKPKGGGGSTSRRR
jgi:hypothetical protein